MRQYGNKTVAIAGRSAIRTGLALAGDPHAHLIIDACRNLHLGRYFSEHLASAAAARARMLDRRTLAMARGASRLNAHDAGRLNDPSLAAAIAAHFAPAALSRSAAFALPARLVALEFNCFRCAMRRL